jgi:uncharacterized protein DUF2441
VEAYTFGYMDEANVTRDETETIDYGDRDYYHINTLPEYSPYERLSLGDEVDVGGSTNPFFLFYWMGAMSYHVPEEIGAPQGKVRGVKYLNLIKEGRMNPPERVYRHHASEIARDLVTRLREVIWEDVRKTEFPDRPSRQKCIWLVPNRNGLRYWLDQMGVHVRGLDWQVLRVRVQGRLHKANQDFLIGDNMGMRHMVEEARNFWRGVDVGEEAERAEILFEGRMRVEQIMPTSFYS